MQNLKNYKIGCFSLPEQHKNGHWYMKAEVDKYVLDNFYSKEDVDSHHQQNLKYINDLKDEIGRIKRESSKNYSIIILFMLFCFGMTLLGIYIV